MVAGCSCCLVCVDLYPAGCCGSSIRLVGLVGTYHQGLDYIAELQHQKLAVQQYSAAPAGPEGDGGDEGEGSGSGTDGSSTSTCCPLRLLSGVSMGSESCARSNSSISTDVAIEITPGDPNPAGYAEKGGLTAAGAAACGDGDSQQLQLPVGGAPRVVLWLGSSIGNCSREQAAVFLRQVQEKALRTGGCGLGLGGEQACPLQLSCT